MEISEQKKIMRCEIKKQFKNLDRKEFLPKSEKVLDSLKSFDFWNEAQAVLAFVSMKDEISTMPMLKYCLDNKKMLAVPKVTGSELEFHIVTALEKDLAPGAFGISEPQSHTAILNLSELPEKKTVILVPGLAFDKNNYRLGRGKGFYDRFFNKLPPHVIKIGICYDFQFVSSVPVEQHDRKLDFVVMG